MVRLRAGAGAGGGCARQRRGRAQEAARAREVWGYQGQVVERAMGFVRWERRAGGDDWQEGLLRREKKSGLAAVRASVQPVGEAVVMGVEACAGWWCWEYLGWRWW